MFGSDHQQGHPSLVNVSKPTLWICLSSIDVCLHQSKEDIRNSKETKAMLSQFLVIQCSITDAFSNYRLCSDSVCGKITTWWINLDDLCAFLIA